MNKITKLLITLLALTSCRAPESSTTAVEAVRGKSAESVESAAPAARQAFFGDLHLHTAMSFDAAAANTATTPDEAYRFAQGEAVRYFGRNVQRRVPLDFLAVTDHAEYMGIAVQAAEPQGPFAGTTWPARLREAHASMAAFLGIFSPSGFRGGPPVKDFLAPDLVSGNWQRQIAAAERHNHPGKFTTFVAYEWSPMPGGAHMHRNVIFRGPKYPQLPFTAIDSLRPEDLWSYAEARQREGSDLLLIPHNSNLSDGLMFALQDSDGKPFTRAYAERRSRLERLAEISQNKGTSETRPELSPADGFADFELVNFGKTDAAASQGGYLRPALKHGLEQQQQVGANPFKLGLIGSSDFHSGLSSSEENNFPGGLGDGDEQSDPNRVLTSVNPLLNAPVTVLSASGLTGVWAERNTRDSLFAALQRREVFATSGNRMRVRLFAGWDYAPGLTADKHWVDLAYLRGVAMGSDLPMRRSNNAPRLLLHAVKDPDAGNLDRIQVVKLWLQNGVAQEKVIDAVWAGQRKLQADGKLPPIGNSVDIATATYHNNIGAAELLGEWSDPEFDPAQPALYYARVLEIPTPRWSTYLAVRNKLPLPTSVPATIQERAWSSPVFYNP